MDELNIDDKRNTNDFRGITFSKYKKSDVKKELLNSINNNKIENACNWTAELICAGHCFHAHSRDLPDPCLH